MSYAWLWRAAAAAKARRRSLRRHLAGPVLAVHALINDLDKIGDTFLF
jgi:hypothetical protein